jgi:YegS/Rv2252/BmrU family lipid kinase
MPPSRPSIAVIVNVRAGAAMGQPTIGAELAARFQAAGHEAEIIALRDGDSPSDAARDAATRVSIVVAAGGDGTVSSVAEGIVGSAAALGVLPLGTLNHFARDLRIPAELDAAIAVVAAGRIGQIDVGQVNDRLFVNNSSIGLYPSIVDARDALRSQGHRKWVAMAIAILRIVRRYRGMKVTIEIDGRTRMWRTPFVFVGNNEYTIDGLQLGGRAALDAGTLFVYMAPRLRARGLPLLLIKALLGRARRSGDFEIVATTALWIDRSKSRRRRVACDGEVVKMRTPLHYRVLPKGLRVVLPPG